MVGEVTLETHQNAHILKLLLLLRLFLRFFAFAYPLYLTVMYNFWVFERLSMNLWIGYVAFMAILELVLVFSAGRAFSTPLLRVYVIIAIVMEFPFSLLGMRISTMLPFLLWMSLWYGSLALIAVLALRS
ncbi:hypothetical protein [Thermococcus sp.]|uniref:hypothetical protein n=1 Tax=Thermococcus sp. TaxID=35749 RepID=UPI0026312390|nr:hypothetical protein [Thermococcus sp.]